MKKRNVINLIKYYAEKNDNAFKNEAFEIARDFDDAGDYQLAEYIMALMSDANAFTPQSYDGSSEFFQKIEPSNSPLPLPDAISNDISGIVNAVSHNAGINKFLFQGPPGTGKTETVKQIARIINRDLFAVNFNTIIDSKLGQTAKNIHSTFQEINTLINPEKAIIFFDEIDSLALDRVNQHDVREMGRATSAFLKELDAMNEQVILVATTNLYKSLDKALARRFDATIDFARYSKQDLLDIADFQMAELLTTFKSAGRNMRLFRKIMNLMSDIPFPGDLRNLLRTAVAFSNPNDEFDYLKKLYASISQDTSFSNLSKMREQGFTLREIEVLTGVPRSSISRELKESEV